MDYNLLLFFFNKLNDLTFFLVHISGSTIGTYKLILVRKKYFFKHTCMHYVINSIKRKKEEKRYDMIYNKKYYPN